MNIFRRFKSLVSRAPQEQIAGYSLPELKSVYTEALLPLPRPWFDYPQVIALKDAGVPAYYSSFLITAEDADKFAALVESSFSFVVEKPFNDHSVKRYSNAQKNEHLIYFISGSEFNATTVRMVTNSVDFLGVVLDSRWAVPPPWVAFEGYKASWWGGNMQGAQGYYDGSYFLPFFTRLNGLEKQEYYARFHATPEWIECLELMYGDG
jgi:hypothetical protein